MAKRETKTEFFESVVADKNVPGATLVIFFLQAYREKEREGENDEQVRLLDLLKEHRPELEQQAAEDIIQGYGR